MPIVVGAHTFHEALIDGLFEGPKPDPELRQSSGAWDCGRLEAVDPDSAARIHPADTRRTIRGARGVEQTGQTITSLQTQWTASTRAIRGAVGRAGGRPRPSTAESTRV